MLYTLQAAQMALFVYPRVLKATTSCIKYIGCLEPALRTAYGTLPWPLIFESL